MKSFLGEARMAEEGGSVGYWVAFLGHFGRVVWERKERKERKGCASGEWGSCVPVKHRDLPGVVVNDGEVEDDQGGRSGLCWRRWHRSDGVVKQVWFLKG